MALIRDAFTIVGKDMLLEFRGKESFFLMLFLSLLFLVIFNFAMDIDKDNVASLAPGILWVIFAFSGILGMGRTSGMERDEDAYLGIVFSPVSEESLYLGKAISNMVFLFVMEIFTMVIFAVLFDYSRLIELLPSLLPAFVLGTMGFALVGTLFSFLTGASKYGEVLLPFLFLPVVVPVVLGGVSSMKAVLEAAPAVENWKWVQILGVFDALYFSASLLLFKHLIEE